MQLFTDFDNALTPTPSHRQPDFDLQIVQRIHRQAAQARRALADAYGARLVAFVRRQLRPLAPQAGVEQKNVGRGPAERQAISTHNTGGTPCPR